MLRIIHQLGDAKAELKRICDRTHDDQVTDKETTVREIVEAVRLRGDQALLHYTQKFDQQVFTASTLKVDGAQLDAAYQQVSQGLLKAIQKACKNIEKFHRPKAAEKLGYL